MLQIDFVSLLRWLDEGEMLTDYVVEFVCECIKMYTLIKYYAHI